jgi:NAD(P)-dependent dehydrogenase (short-subunit alcohol dehydrogenase family)
MTGTTLRDRRVLLVGASAGIGRALAVQLVGEGARVVMAARRAGRLEETAAEAAGGHPVAADITSAEDCARLAETAARTLGGIDVLISTAGYAPMAKMDGTGPDDWRRLFATNVAGFHQVLRACLGSLAPNAVVTVLSSESVNQPRLGLGAYAASKVALERMLEAWRIEHPELRFCRIRMGQTYPTEFGDHFGAEILGEALTEWDRRGLAVPEAMTPGEAAGVIRGLLALALAYPMANFDDLTLRASSAASKISEL